MKSTKTQAIEVQRFFGRFAGHCLAGFPLDNLFLPITKKPLALLLIVSILFHIRQANTRANKMKIEQILNNVYGVGIVCAPACAVLWATEKIEDKDEARKELKKANKIRGKHGAPYVYPPYGHHAY